jgi:elongation factor P
MINAGDVKRGTTIELDGDLYQVLEYQHTKIAQRANNIKMKLRNLKTGNVLERTVPSDQRFPLARLEAKEVQYLYHDGALYHFMDTSTYDQEALGEESLGDTRNFLKEGMTLQLVSYKDRPVGIDLPTTVDLKVVETVPGVKGDTAQGGTKPARLETGLNVKVPLYINEGETVRIDTRDGSFVERVG